MQELGHSEQPESARLLSNNLEKVSDYLRRQDSSEMSLVSDGKCFRASSCSSTTGPSDGSLMTPEECTEHTSEKEELKQEVEELRATIDELRQQLAEARINYPEADLTSDETCESLSRLEAVALIRTQSQPEQLLTAHKKIEILQVTNTQPSMYGDTLGISISTNVILHSNAFVPLYLYLYIYLL